MKKLLIVAGVFLLGASFVWYQWFAFTLGVVEISNQTKVRVSVSQQIDDDRSDSSLAPGMNLARMSKGVLRDKAPSVVIRHPNYERSISGAEFEHILSAYGAHIVAVVVEESGVRFVTLDAQRQKTPIQPPQHNAGSRSYSSDLPVSESPSSLGPRG